MIPYIIVAICIISGIFAWKIEKDYINPITLFCSLWALCVFLASLRLFNLLETSETTYAYILLGTGFFIIGGLTGKRIKITVNGSRRRRSNQVSNNDGSSFYENIDNITSINYKLLYFFIVIIYLYCTWRLFNILLYIRNGFSWWSIRLMSTTGQAGIGTIRGTFIYQALYNWIVSPIVYILAPTVLVDFFVGKRNWMFIIVAMGSIVLYSIVTVSRSVWGFMIIYMAILLFIFRKRFHLTKRVKKILRWVPVLIVGVFGIIVYITFLRNEDASILANAYAYLAGGIPLFDLHLSESISSTRTYGMLSLSGFLYPVFFLLTRTRLFSYPAAFLAGDAIKANLEIYHSIGDNIRMNAYATLFYDFYIDFGVAGIAGMSFIFGYICYRCYKNMLERLDLASLITYLLICQYILFSMARIYSTLTTRAISFVWIPILLSQHRKFRISSVTKQDR